MIKIIKQTRVMETATIEKNENSHNRKGNLLVFCVFCLLFWSIANEAIGQTWNIGNPGYNSNVKATLSGNTLTISGSGNMVDFWDSTEGEAPWWKNDRTSIRNVVIQSGVTNIGNRAFKECNNLNSVQIAGSVTIIGRRSFDKCNNLTSITIPNSVTEIEGEAFYDCTNLRTVEIEDGSSTLNFSTFNYTGSEYPRGWKYDWFKNCPIQTLHMGKNCTQSGSTPPFYGILSLQSLTVGINVTSIVSSAFANCNNLTSVTITDAPSNITFGGSMSMYSCFNGCPVKTLHLGRNINSSSNSYTFRDNKTLTTLTIGNNVSSVPNSTFSGCTALSSVKLSNSMTTIGDGVFSGCSSLKSIDISSITSIGSNAFYDCGFESLIIPTSVISIGSSAYANCNNLTSITITDAPSNITFGGSMSMYSCFNGCPVKTLHLGRNINSSSNSYTFRDNKTLTTLTIGNNVSSVPNSTFSGCIVLSSVTLSSAMNTIGNNVFYGCSSLKSININSITSIGDNAFAGCGFESLTIPTSVTSIGSSAYANCNNLTSITITDAPSNITFGGSMSMYSCFNGCPVKTLHLGRNINSSSNSYTFRDNKTLTTLTIGNNVSSIPNNIFSGCIGLTEIKSNAIAPPTIQTNTFYNVNRSISVKLPCNSLNAYKADQYWNTFTNMTDGGCSEIEDIATERFQIFPSPAKEEIFIKSELPVNSVEIYSLPGALVFSEPNFTGKILISDLPKGIYVVRVYAETGVVTEKIIKE